MTADMSSPLLPESCDVLIIGASMAGSGLARQLKLRWPQLSVVVVDRKTEFKHWVGEATVPPWTDYAVRHLKLGPYLWKNHIVKHGVRFFFDSEAKDLSLPEMSEFGRREYPVIASFQIDRERFDKDMVRMNAEIGVLTSMGTKVLAKREDGSPGIEIDGEQGHRVHTSRGSITCKWLVDSSGMANLLPRHLGLLRSDWDRLPNSSYWARFRNTVNIDEMGDDAWRRRVGFTERNLSGNHYLYRGYWIWQIPVDEETISLGVTFDESIVKPKIRNGEDLTTFLRQHRAMRDLLGEESELLDFSALRRLARHTEQFCSTDRWCVTGMSASFIDPLFASNCMGIAAFNLLIGALIEADLEGSSDKFQSRVDHFNSFFQVFHEAQLRTIDYDRHACFESWAPYRMAMLNNLVNWIPAAYFGDLDIVTKVADANIGQPAPPPELLVKSKLEAGYGAAIRRFKDEFTDFLDERGSYFLNNRAQFLEGTERASAQRHMFTELTQELNQERAVEDEISLEALVRHCLGRMAEIEGIVWSEDAFTAAYQSEMNANQTLAGLLEALRDAPAPEADVEAWSPKGPPDRNVIGWVRSEVGLR